MAPTEFPLPEARTKGGSFSIWPPPIQDHVARLAEARREVPTRRRKRLLTAPTKRLAMSLKKFDPQEYGGLTHDVGISFAGFDHASSEEINNLAVTMVLCRIDGGEVGTNQAKLVEHAT